MPSSPLTEPKRIITIKSWTNLRLRPFMIKSQKLALSHNRRPLSPHLQIYKPQITSVLSITHRITGFGLTICLFILVGWLACLATGEDAFLKYQGFLSNILGQIICFFALFGFFYHFCNGIRHLFWDAGYGFSLSATYKSGWFTIGSSILLSLLTWIGL